MNIGILGSGDVGKTLGNGFLHHGHAVMMGTRDASKLAEWARKNPKAKIGSPSQAAKFGEVIVLAVKGDIAADALKGESAQNLAGKVIMDACNPVADAPPVNGVLKFFTTHDESLMEILQKEFPSAHFVKAFNSVGVGVMINPRFADGKPTMFICGNDESAKKTASKILDQFGWETADMGKAEAARAIEPLCLLWCIPGFTRNEWTHAFKLLHK